MSTVLGEFHTIYDIDKVTLQSSQTQFSQLQYLTHYDILTTRSPNIFVLELCLSSLINVVIDLCLNIWTGP